jgi:TonB-dependent starch-binding outer membrane protein SusC
MRRNHLVVLIALMFMSIRANAQRVSFSGDQISLERFFSAVTNQTGFVFFYNASIFKNASPISIHVVNIPVDSAMRIALKNQPYLFAIRGKTIFITADETVPSSSTPITSEKNPDIFIIKGLVTDQSGNPLAGASVFTNASHL